MSFVAEMIDRWLLCTTRDSVRRRRAEARARRRTGRRRFSWLLLTACLLPLPAHAAGTARILVLWSARSDGFQKLYGVPDRAFVDELGRNGFSERNGLEIQERSLDEKGQDDRQRFVRQLLTNKPDLVLTLGTGASQLVADAESAEPSLSIPIVYAMVFQAPGGDHVNATGVTLGIPPAEQFESLHSVVPPARRIGVVYNPRNALSSLLIEEATTAVKTSGMTLLGEPAETSPEVVKALGRLSGRVDAIWMVPDSVSVSPEVMEWSRSHRIPVIGLSDSYVEDGALLALFPDYVDVGRQAAELAVKILRGASANTLAPRRPRRTLLYINLATARKLDIPVSNVVRDTADRLVQQPGE